MRIREIMVLYRTNDLELAWITSGVMKVRSDQPITAPEMMVSPPNRSAR